MIDTSDVRATLFSEGPCASVVLSTPSATEDAEKQLGRRWRNARRTLEDAAIDPAELERLDHTVAELDHGDGAAVVLLQPWHAPPFVEFLDDAVDHDLAVVDELARVGPVLESRQRSLPHLIVVADRAGADIIGMGTDIDDELVGVDAEKLHLHRGHPGGWSQRRFQQRAENQWESNAEVVAEQVERMARRLDPRLITIAGDVRAVGFLLEHLPSDLNAISHKLEGQSVERIADETVRLVADLVARDSVAVLERFREAVGEGRAADGAEQTLSALSSGRVETLVVHDDPADSRRAYFDRNGLWCGVEPRSDSPSSAPDEAVDGRLIDVALRSALKGDARIHFVPAHGGPAERLGALLRW